jgi:ABC-type phosphate transport system substrate-binding protein
MGWYAFNNDNDVNETLLKKSCLPLRKVHGVVKTWNAPQIAKLNPDLNLPDRPIRVIERPAGKGSNYVFSDFLSKSSTRFRAQVGVTASPSGRWANRPNVALTWPTK